MARRTTERVAKAFYDAALRMIGVRKSVAAALDTTIETLEAASSGIRDMDTGHTEAWREARRKELDVWCTICNDTGISDGGWFDGCCCDCCAMGVLRDEAEKAGLIVPSKELLERRECSA